MSETVVAKFADSVGNCDYCSTTETLVIQPSELRDYFEKVIGLYNEADDASQGQDLLVLLEDDWQIFSKRLGAVGLKKALIEKIMGDPQLFVRHYEAPLKGPERTLEKWQDFKLEIVSVNRFHPENQIGLESLAKLLAVLLIKSGGCAEYWYRARIGDADQQYALTEMGAPPASKATSGRANPAGIAYLYLASDQETALCETRPHPGHYVTVAKYELDSGLNFVDLRDPISSISPFQLDDDEMLSSVRREIGFLSELAVELTRPVVPSTADFEYVPSQYLCEYVKSIGYDGVVYGSSVGNGFNVALFSPSDHVACAVDLMYIKSVELTSEKCSAE